VFARPSFAGSIDYPYLWSGPNFCRFAVLLFPAFFRKKAGFCGSGLFLKVFTFL